MSISPEKERCCRLRAPAHVGTAALVGAAALGARDLSVILAAVAGGILADVDTPHSVIGKIFFFVSHPLNRIFGHRSLTHSLLGAAITTLIVYALAGTNYALAWGLGYASHLGVDMLTVQGVPLLWPYCRYYGLRLGRTGGIVEMVYALALVWVWFGTTWGRSVLASP